MRRPRILVVDDEVYIVHILEFSLTIEGYEVITATSAEEALQKLEEEQPDLLVLDAALGDTDGHDFAVRLRDDERLGDTPIIFLYAQETAVDRDRGRRLGARTYIPKPFSPQRLIEEIRSALSCDDTRGEQVVGM